MSKKNIHIKSDAPSMVRVDNIGKKFGGIPVLNGLSFDMKSGETLVLMGSSGCGKTTLLRLIAGLEQPDCGEIYLGNEFVSKPEYSVAPHKRSISMVFQDLALWPHMTVNEHLDFAIDHHKYCGKQRTEKITALLNQVQLKNSRAYPHQLSGGEQQRLAIVRALAPEPDILLFDEPLSNLDLQLKRSLLREIKRLSLKLGITVLYVTHQPEEAMYVADTVAVMDNGEIVSHYTVAEFIRQQQKLWERNYSAYTRDETKDTVIHLNTYAATQS